jgi:hypothetical protein
MPSAAALIGGAARAPELGKQGGEEDGEDIGDPRDEEHAGEGEPKARVRQGFRVPGHARHY